MMPTPVPRPAMHRKRQDISIPLPDLPSSSSSETTSSALESSTTVSSTTVSSTSETSSSIFTPPTLSSSDPQTSSTPSSTTTTSSTTTQRQSTVVSTVATTVTVDGSTFVSSSVQSSVMPAPQTGGGGLSSGAKAGIIGGVCGAAGLILLVIFAFFLRRWYRKRRSDYTPDGDELKWPEMQEDAGTLFPAAVQRNAGHGVGGGLDRGDTMRSIGTAGIASASSPTAYQPSTISHGYSSNEYAGEGTGLAAGAAGMGAAAYNNNFAARHSLYDGAQEPQYHQPQYPQNNNGWPAEEAQPYGQGYQDEGYAQQPQQQQQRYDGYDTGAYDGYSDERPASGSDLDRYGSVMSRPDKPSNLRVANA